MQRHGLCGVAAMHRAGRRRADAAAERRSDGTSWPAAEIEDFCSGSGWDLENPEVGQQRSQPGRSTSRAKCQTAGGNTDEEIPYRRSDLRYRCASISIYHTALLCISRKQLRESGA